VSYASSLDTVGILANRVKHVKRVFGKSHCLILEIKSDVLSVDTLNVHDAKDPTAIPPSYRPKQPTRSLGKLRIGIPMECFPSELSKQGIAPTRRAIQLLRSLGAEIASVSIPSITRALSAYYTIASSEASSNLAKYDGIRYGFRSEGTHTDTRTAAFGEEVQKRIILGTYALTAE
jgi:aspartyl-tRNA(Asn)/glutamyl-tRNA(Gln) amidotransferase subunit A